MGVSFVIPAYAGIQVFRLGVLVFDLEGVYEDSQS